MLIPNSVEHNPVRDLVTTVQFIAEECVPKGTLGICLINLGDKKHGILRSIVKSCHRRLPNQLIESVQEFNRVLEQLKKEGKVTNISGNAVSTEFCGHVLEQAYARCVAPKAHMLREYKGILSVLMHLRIFK